MPKDLSIHDERALLSQAKAPSAPAEAQSVADCFEDPLLVLELAGHKKTQAYEAWLWAGNDGQAYFSKKTANGRTMAWRPGATIERAIIANPSMRRALRPKAKGHAKDKRTRTNE